MQQFPSGVNNGFGDIPPFNNCPVAWLDVELLETLSQWCLAPPSRGPGLAEGRAEFGRPQVPCRLFWLRRGRRRIEKYSCMAARWDGLWKSGRIWASMIERRIHGWACNETKPLLTGGCLIVDAQDCEPIFRSGSEALPQLSARRRTAKRSLQGYKAKSVLYAWRLARCSVG